MAVAAIHHAVNFVELHAGDGVFEVILVPAAVTGDALRIDFCYPFAGRMAGAALEFLVVSTQFPAGFSVREAGAFFGIVTFYARVLCVAAIAHGVHFFVGFSEPRGSLEVVAVAAVFLFVAVHASQIEQVDMLAVMEGHDGRRLVRGQVDLCGRRRDDGVGDAHDIS